MCKKRVVWFEVTFFSGFKFQLGKKLQELKFHHNLRDAINTGAFYVLNFTRIFSFTKRWKISNILFSFLLALSDCPIYFLSNWRLVHSRFTPKANFIRIVYISLSVMFQRPLFSYRCNTIYCYSYFLLQCSLLITTIWRSH